MKPGGKSGWLASRQRTSFQRSRSSLEARLSVPRHSPTRPRPGPGHRPCPHRYGRCCADTGTRSCRSRPNVPGRVGQPHPVHGQRGRPEQSQGLRVGHGRTTGRSEIPGQHPAGKQRRQIPPARGEQFHFALEFGQMQTKGRAPVLADRVSPTQIVRARGIEGMAAGRDRAGSLGERCHGRVQSGRDEGLRQRPKTEGLVADQELEPGSGQGPDNRRPGAAADINDSAGPVRERLAANVVRATPSRSDRRCRANQPAQAVKPCPLGERPARWDSSRWVWALSRPGSRHTGPRSVTGPENPVSTCRAGPISSTSRPRSTRAGASSGPAPRTMVRACLAGRRGPEGRPGTQCLSAGRDLVMKAWSLRTCSSKKARLSCNLAVSALLADVSTAYGVSRRRCNIF